MPESNQMFGKVSGDTPDFFIAVGTSQIDWNPWNSLKLPYKTKH